jgi:hypothetical protein
MRVWTGALLAALAGLSAASAQVPTFPSSRSADTAVNLLLNGSVQAELKIGAGEGAKLKGLAAEVRARHEPAAREVADLQRAWTDQLQAHTRALADAEARAVADALTPEQLSRLRQLEWQRRGPFFFGEAETHEALKMTPEQVAAARSDLIALRREVRPSFGPRDPAAEKEQQEKAAAAFKRAEAALVARLDDGQKKRLRGLLGEPLPGLPVEPQVRPARATPAAAAAELVELEAVRAELKLTKDQADKLTRAPADAAAATRGLRDKIDRARQDYGAKQAAAAKALADDLDKELLGCLRPEQIKRLRQIEVQRKSLNAFADEKVLAALKLSDDQKAALARMLPEEQTALLRASLQARQDARDKSGTRREQTEQARLKVEALSRAAVEKVAGALPPEARAAWQGLVGAPFDYKPDPTTGRFGRDR